MIIYHLTNDLLRYLLKYATRNSFPEEIMEKMLDESAKFVKKYKKAPGGTGFLAWKLFVAANSYLNERSMKTKNKC